MEKRKTLWWMGDSRERLREFPEDVRSEIGMALNQAELGESHPSMKRMQGLNAVEIISDFAGNTYRSVYTTKFKGHLYVLNCFMKKSKTGSKTPRVDLQLIEKRLIDAKEHFRALEKAERARK